MHAPNSDNAVSPTLRFWMQLTLTEGIGPILSRRLIESAGSAEAACNATLEQVAAVEGIGSTKARKILAALRNAQPMAADELERCREKSVAVFCPDDAQYPFLLRSIPDPPTVLYVKGTLEPRDLNGVAIVGSRRCSFYGREQAERFAALLAGVGVTVVSGGARGIDSAAHRGALSHPQGRTVAVLGSGVDVPYPPENASLFEQIAQRGAVISEFPLGTSPARENFPRRNRIVSGVSRGVLVVEADEKSGALITARQACDDHCRPVFALPGRVDNPLSAGPHLLIRDGAILVTKLEDILDGLGPVPAEASEPMLFDSAPQETVQLQRPSENTDGAILTERQRIVLSGIGDDSAAVDLIVERTGLSAQEVLQDLTILSLKGQIRRTDGQTYERR